MTSTPHPASPYAPSADEDRADPIYTATDVVSEGDDWLAQPDLPVDHGAGGRAVLGWGLTIAAVAWLAFSAWSAGLALGGSAISAPLVAQWIAIGTGPLALLGLAWLVFGRTRRKEAEAFTRSVVAMRGEARALDGLLAVVRQRIDDNHRELRSMAGQLMNLGDETTERLSTATSGLDASARRLADHGETFDRAAHAARVDLGVLLEDLPRAESVTRSLAESLQQSAASANEQSERLRQQVSDLGDVAAETDARVGDATDSLANRLTKLQDLQAATIDRIGSVNAESSVTLDRLLDRTAEVLDEIRNGISIQAQAVEALVSQARSGLHDVGSEAAETLRARLGEAQGSLDLLGRRILEQDESARMLVASIGGGLAALDEQFTGFAESGDQRAAAMVATLSQMRSELDDIATRSGESDGSLASLAERTADLHQRMGGLAESMREDVHEALGRVEGRVERLVTLAEQAQPVMAQSREHAEAAVDRLETGARLVEQQHERLAELLQAVDTGVGGAERRLNELGSALGSAHDEAARLSAETGPALVASLVQVKEAAAHAAERAREAIAAVIPQSAANLSDAARKALEEAVQRSVADQLGALEITAGRAVEAARGASERLTQQMLSIGQSAAALEAHLARTEAERSERDSEAFAKKVSLLIDSMHSASIDVGKILSDDVDDRIWAAYLKGDRSAFTRRASRLIGSSDTRQLQDHYASDIEFQDSVNRFVHDFEAMLRRVTAERDGGPIAVTLMSSDMGKLYTALAPIAGGRRQS